MTLNKMTEIYTQFIIVCPNVTSKFRTIAIFKSLVKQNSESNKTCRYVHDLLLHQALLTYVLLFMCCLHKAEY
jgi:hypothetical protein